MKKSFKFSLEKWNFKENTYYGSVLYRGSKNLTDIFLQEGCPVTVREMDKLSSQIQTAVKFMLSEGHTINIFDMFHIQPVIKGVFRSSLDEFDPMRHSIQVKVNSSFSLKEIHKEKMIKIRKILPDVPGSCQSEN